MKRHRFLFAWLFCLSVFFAVAASSPARAAEVSATAALSEAETDVGQEVDYTITLTGGEGRVPENIAVDGLSITYSGQSSSTQITFGSMFGSGAHSQTSTVYTYSVVPQRAGRFEIPAQDVDVDGQKLTTRPVNLTVGGGGGSGTGSGSSLGSGGGSGAGSAGSSNSPLYFAQLIIPKTTAYIGETVPAEAKVYVEAHIAQQLLGPPDIAAEACTLQPLSKPTQAQIERDGKTYIVVTYKTAFTPAKAGTLKVGPISSDCMVRMPEARTHHRSPFDNPFFNDPFFDDAFRMMGPPQQVTIKSDAASLEVKPLPAEGQPKSFAGAVGQYTLSTSVKPATVQAGDPITLTAKIEGRGNFDRVTAPQLADAAGWRAYPPSAKFSADDDVGISGAKTFEMAVIPEQAKTASPALEWSYFDPEKEKYLTLTGAPVPIQVQGAAPSPSAPAVAQQPQAAPTPSAPDILYIRADSAGWGETFRPLYESRTFWAAQAAPLLALLAFIGFGVKRNRAADSQARERAEWRREKEAALAEIRRRDLPERDLCHAATQALRLEAALRTGQPPAMIDGETVLAARHLDAATAERIRQLFDRDSEALYAGVGGRSQPASPETKADVLELVKQYENAGA